MDKNELQKLRDLPIEGVAERLGIRVSRGHKSLCPFHEDHHPSLSYSIRRNSFRCFVCDAHGDPIDLVMHHLHLPFRDACRWLANSHNIITEEYHTKASTDENTHTFSPTRYARFFEQPRLSVQARHFLFEQRKLSPRVVEWCRITSWHDRQGTPWLQTPYYDMEGQLIGVQNRNLAPLNTQPRQSTGNATPQPRFRFPRGSRCSIYNLPILRYLSPGESLWITEGCSDCWAMLSCGKKAIAIPSATLLSAHDRQFLSSLSSSYQFHMFPDNDAPGKQLFLQLREVLPSLHHHQLPAECKDFSEMYLTLKP